ncbi:hypothetical protein [Streptomyces sp. 1222.5]|uniref:hypothetical protein n=1 Tax=Streptomyces sp. 1222.5 TaxID=1881026 RepID=UPI003EBFD182
MSNHPPPPAAPPLPPRPPAPARNKRTTRVIVAGVVAGALVVAVGVWWLLRPSYDDMVKDCRKALTASATKTHRPEACEGLKQGDYETLLLDWALTHALDEMPKDDRDMLDYYDDGSINGSLTDGE